MSNSNEVEVADSMQYSLTMEVNPSSEAGVFHIFPIIYPGHVKFQSRVPILPLKNILLQLFFQHDAFHQEKTKHIFTHIYFIIYIPIYPSVYLSVYAYLSNQPINRSINMPIVLPISSYIYLYFFYTYIYIQTLICIFTCLYLLLIRSFFLYLLYLYGDV